MDKYIISIFDNKSFSEMLSEINIFSKFEIKHYKNIDYFKNNHESLDELLIFFNNNLTKDLINNGKLNNKPLILVSESKETSNFKLSDFSEIMTVPFKIIDFKKKVISLISKVQFRKNSLIYLKEYIIDKNERKIKKK